MEAQWIKIVTNIFEDEKIVLIDALPDNDAIIVIWFKLLMLAGKINNRGILAMNDKVSYTDENLSSIFHRPVNTVRMALKVFETFDMIEIVEGVVTIPKWEKHQSVDAMDKIREQTRKRVANHRQKQKELVNGNVTCNVTVTQCNATDKDIDKDKELSNLILSINNKREIYDHFQQATGRMLESLEMEKFEQKVAKLQPSLALVKKAIDEAVATHDAKKCNLAYIVGILKNWGSRGWTTPEMVEKAKQEYLASQQVSNVEVTADFLAALELFKEVT